MARLVASEQPMTKLSDTLATGWRRLVDAINWVFATAWMGAIIPFFSIGVGFAWSSWKEQIADSFLVMARPGDANFDVKSTFFWLLCLLLLLLGIGNTWAKNRDSARSAAEVKALLARLQEQSQQHTAAVSQLHSLPPLGVLEDFHQAYNLCDNISIKSLQLNTAVSTALSDHEAALRTFMSVVGRVIQTFDGEHFLSSNVRYGLNIMLFVTKQEYEARPLKAALATRLRFADKGLSLDNAAGVLDMLPAVSIADGMEMPDSELEHFAIPIADVPVYASKASKERPALPGATHCCVNIIHVAYESIDAFRKALEDLQADDGVKAEMLSYFEKPNIRSSVQSFLCVPLIASDTGLVGVLNIHRDTANPRIKDRMALLVPLLAPMRQQLARLLLKYKSLYLS